MNLNVPLGLSLKVKNYSWGKVGSSSLVARFLAPAKYEEDVPYAELWLGAHSNGCAELVNSSLSLSQLISAQPEHILGARAVEKFGPAMPFLAKILSVNTALSIQAHPDKKLAAELHARDPQHYPDSNHKPEVALALSDVRLLYGFKTREAVQSTLKSTPEFGLLIGNEGLSAQDSAAYIKAIYRSIVSPQHKDMRQRCIQSLVKRLEQLGAQNESEELVLELFEQFSDREIAYNDPGILSPLIMNIVTLPPGNALFIGAGVLHSYLSGDLVECMANSDNVVRGGLTQKFCDLPVLMEMVDYNIGFPEIIAAKGTADPHVVTFPTPAKEFTMQEFKAGPLRAIYDKNAAMQLIFCLTGRAEVEAGPGKIELNAGGACIIPAVIREYSVSFSNARVFRFSTPLT